jgi:hypothetical protein
MHSYHCPHDLETLSRSDPDLWRGINFSIGHPQS